MVMSEETEAAGGDVRLVRPAHAGQNVRRRSEHVRAGEAVLLAGRRLRSHDSGWLRASAPPPSGPATTPRGDPVDGRRTRRRARSARRSAAYDGNRPLLAALIGRAGAELIDLGISTDDDADFTARLEQAARARADVLITTGGAAQGEADVVRKHGEVEFFR